MLSFVRFYIMQILVSSSYMIHSIMQLHYML